MSETHNAVKRLCRHSAMSHIIQNYTLPRFTRRITVSLFRQNIKCSEVDNSNNFIIDDHTPDLTWSISDKK